MSVAQCSVGQRVVHGGCLVSDIQCRILARAVQGVQNYLKRALVLSTFISLSLSHCLLSSLLTRLLSWVSGQLWQSSPPKCTWLCPQFALLTLKSTLCIQSSGLMMQTDVIVHRLGAWGWAGQHHRTTAAIDPSSTAALAERLPSLAESSDPPSRVEVGTP